MAHLYYVFQSRQINYPMYISLLTEVIFLPAQDFVGICIWLKNLMFYKISYRLLALKTIYAPILVP
jgi:hypothetical protein